MGEKLRLVDRTKYHSDWEWKLEVESSPTSGSRGGGIRILAGYIMLSGRKCPA